MRADPAPRRGPPPRIILAALALAAGLAPGSSPRAAPPRPPLVYAVIVGNNDGLGMLPQLNYADDDALRFYRLAVRLAPKENVALLTELDVDTWRRIQLSGARPPPFLPPTRKRLLEVVRLFKAQIARARRAHPLRPVHLYFFFSGHGERGYFFLKRKDGPLAEAAFTGGDLERTFADSPATLNWLFIDACKSQSLFVAKGALDGEDDELGPDFSGLIDRLDAAVARAPIGVLTSTVSDKPAGEARDIRGGYFSHVLTSGLRGAADANSDGVVRYGELAAFVSFHTRRVAGQRPWFRPPQGRLDEPLIQLRRRTDLLELLPGVGGHFLVLDQRGQHLVMEVHKTAAQHSRLILSPGRYRVVRVVGPRRGLAAEVRLEPGTPARLGLTRFKAPVALGPDSRPKGEALGAPPDPEGDSQALLQFDPTSSGFDQPFTPRVVSALAAAYNSGLSVARPAPPPDPGQGRHSLGAGFAYLAPPVEPYAGGMGVSLAYAHRLGLPLRLGARVLLGLSEHHTGAGDPYTMYRVMLQAEAGYTPPRLWRLSATVGAYLGWQLTLITRQALSRQGEKDVSVTVLNGDAGGFRAGAFLDLRMDLYAGLWAGVRGAGGLELVHEQDSAGQSQPRTFFRPSVMGEVGYAF